MPKRTNRSAFLMFLTVALSLLALFAGCASIPGGVDQMASESQTAGREATALPTGPVSRAPSPTATPTVAAAPAVEEQRGGPMVTQVPPTPRPTLTATPPAIPTAIPPAAPASKPAASPGAALPSVALVRDFASEFREGDLSNLSFGVDGALNLAGKPNGGYVASGELVSPVRSPDWAFTNVVLSWGATSPTASGITVSARARSAGEWSGWYVMGIWRDGKGSSVRAQADSMGIVDVDTLVLSRPADAYQYRVAFESKYGNVSPSLDSVSVALADTRRAATSSGSALPAGWQRELPVPVESQVLQEPSVAWEICSATSLTMVLRYWGAPVTVPQVYAGVRDGTTGIYGNWPLNTAYASELGFDAYVARAASLDFVRAQIAAGRPVPISLKYQAGELSGAALNSTSGHIVVVRGFTADGKAILNDPAAPDLASVRRVVSAEQLEKVWLRSGGIAYVVSPGQ
ncbi:MAG: peptidase C39 family protein [Chloroflexi bacterium]|nr:peptidase C39 family protein [Chloroflexota bacterium]MCL5109644.1 peptidase C39 family protein [Chloroflexota bacterium]